MSHELFDEIWTKNYPNCNRSNFGYFFINIHVIESRLSDCDLRFSKAEEDCINNIYDKVLAGFSWHINYFQLILVLISSSSGKGPSLSPVWLFTVCKNDCSILAPCIFWVKTQVSVMSEMDFSILCWLPFLKLWIITYLEDNSLSFLGCRNR